MRNKVDVLNRKHKPSKRVKVTEDLNATSGGIPSSRRTEDAADTSSYKWQLGKKFQIIFSRHLKVEIAPGSNKRLKSEKRGRRSCLRRGNEGGGMEDVLT